MSSWKDCVSSVSHMSYSDDDSDAINDQSDVAFTTHRFRRNSDAEGNVVCDANGNIDSHDDSDVTDPVVMLSCKSFSSAMHRMVQTGGSCSELIPSVQCNSVLPDDKLASTLWNSGTLSSDGSAVCKKICANFCGKILHLQDDCEVTKWTVSSPVKHIDAVTPDLHDEFKTCPKIHARLSSISSNSDLDCGLLSNVLDVRIGNGKDSEASRVSNPIATKPPSSILVSNSTQNNGNMPSLHGHESSSKSSKHIVTKGNAASKNTVSSDFNHVNQASKDTLSGFDTEEPESDSSKKMESGLRNGSCSASCGKKTIHKSRHVGRKNRTKSKSMSETVELKLKVNHHPEPCQLVSCTPLINGAVLDTEPLQGVEDNASSALLESVTTDDDGEPLVDCNTSASSNQTDSQPLASMKSHSKRSLAKTMSVCLDDSISASPHQRVRRYGYDYDSEPIHMTLEEVKTSLQRLYGQKGLTTPDAKPAVACSSSSNIHNCYLKSISKTPPKKCGAFHIHLRPKKGKDGATEADTKERLQNRKSFPSSIKQTFCSLFGTTKKSMAVSLTGTDDDDDDNELPVSVTNRVHSKSSEELSSRHEDDAVSPNLLNTPSRSIPSLSPFVNRALPPLPLTQNGEKLLDEGSTDVEDPTLNGDDWDKVDEEPLDFTASIQQVKDYGWYWGPISGEMAEKILGNEPDGSFIVRDSSDEHYIFSLTFKLNGLVRHVRIEHDQGNFSFGTFTNFKSQTIVGFIENAVKHSRSGRYLFFLHRRPVLGPMRVQLLHPVSRFKQVQSLQHMCRFVILKAVRRDLIYSLPLPKRLKDYLNTPQYYTEDVDGASDDDHMALRSHPAVTPEQNLLHGAMPETDR